MAAAHRRAEREEMRRFRELEREKRATAKMQASAAAAHAVEAYENLIARIASVHRECGDPWNWEAIAAAAPPHEPRPVRINESSAQVELASYTPSLFDKLLGSVERRRQKLGEDLEAARRADAETNAKARSEFEKSYADWQETRDLARRVLAKDPEAFGEAVEELSPVSEVSDLGSTIRLTFTSEGTASVELHVNGEAVIPPEVFSLLKSGKLSKRKMPPGQFYELYQDYVSGAVFRIARELFALLPLDSVVVTAMGHLLDTSSGHLADRPILSVAMPRATVEKLNFESLDPSDALRNFVHRMNFKRGKGFSPIEPLGLDEVAPQPL